MTSAVASVIAKAASALMSKHLSISLCELDPASPFTSKHMAMATAANTNSWNSNVETDGTSPPRLNPMASISAEAAIVNASPILFIFVSR